MNNWNIELKSYIVCFAMNLKQIIIDLYVVKSPRNVRLSLWKNYICIDIIKINITLQNLTSEI